MEVEISDKAMSWIEKHYSDKTKKSEEMAARLAQKPPEAPIVAANQAEPPQAQPAPVDEEAKKELARWRKKSSKAIAAGESADVDFVTDIIPDVMQSHIHARLRDCKNEAEVKSAFDFRSIGRGEDTAAILEMGAMQLEALKQVLANGPQAT